jgi:two-component system NtrC family sensor kinase
MPDRRKTKAQLIEENAALQQRIAERTLELEAAKAELQESIHLRQRSEELHHRSEQRYRILLDSAGDAIFILTLTGQIVEVNRSACEHLGYSYDELRQMNVAALNAPEQRPYIPARLEKARQQTENFFETILQRRDGTLLNVEVNTRVVEYGGQPAFLSVVRNSTERKRIEETLRRSEASLAEAQRIAHFGSWTWDLTTNKLQCSDEMFRLVGLQPQEIEVTPDVFLKFLPPDGVEGILLKIQQVGAREVPDDLEHQIVRTTGEIRHVYSRVKVYRDENGVPLRLLGSTQDITERKQAELALRRYADAQAALYASALQLTHQLNTPEVVQGMLAQALQLLAAKTSAVALYDIERDVLTLSLVHDRAAETLGRLTGIEYHPGEGLIGQSFQQRRTLVLADAQAWASDDRLGQITPAAVATPLLGRYAPLGVLIMLSDDRKEPFDDQDVKLIELFAAQAAIALENAQLYERQQEQYRRLQEAQARLIQSEKMSALGRLIASISHEINNPLQAVEGCLTLIHDGVEEELSRLSGADRPPWLRDLEVASNEVQRIAVIVQRLRDFYRPTRPGLQATDVAQTIANVLALAAKQLQNSGITVEQAAPIEPFVINTNADQLKQVILNLVLNAIDAMSHGGVLRVATTLETRQLADRPQLTARLDFTDTGDGILPENLIRIFEPFFTTKDTGSGLGLSVSYELVKALGGDLGVISQVGVGSTFTVYLPLEPDYETGSAP